MGTGFFRFFLAFLVVISHMWPQMIHGPAAYAVWAFYLISGYFNTLVLDRKYKYTKKGISDYLYNRALRILPMYAINAFIGLLVLIYLKNINQVSTILNPAFYIPTSLKGILCNIFLLPFWHYGLLVPVAGALFVEFYAYFIIPLMSYNKQSAILSVILCLIFNLTLGITPANFGVRYSSFATCLLPFAVGCLLYMYSDKLSKFSAKYLSFIVWVLHALLWIKFKYYPWHAGLYVSLILTSWVVISLAPLHRSKIDTYLGGLSYDVYLSHTAIGAILLGFFHERTFIFFVTVYFATILCSMLLYNIEEFLQRYKKA